VSMRTAGGAGTRIRKTCAPGLAGATVPEIVAPSPAATSVADATAVSAKGISARSAPELFVPETARDSGVVSGGCVEVDAPPSVVVAVATGLKAPRPVRA